MASTIFRMRPKDKDGGGDGDTDARTWSMPEIRKAGRLGNDRPSLGARLGVGLSKPWGVWEGGFDERLGRPPAGYLGNSLGDSWLLLSPLKLFQGPFSRERHVFDGRHPNKCIHPSAPALLHICFWQRPGFAGNYCLFLSLDRQKSACREHMVSTPQKDFFLC